MKNINLIILIALLLTHCKTESKKQNNQIKSTNINQQEEQIIKELQGKPLKDIKAKEDDLGLKFDFEIVELINSDLNKDDKKDTIKIERIKDWADPGDFHKITVKLTGQNEETFFNSTGWVKIGDYQLQFLNGFKNSSIVESNYISIQKASNNDVLLFCFGYAYASQPGLLSIINLSRFNKSYLIFNDNCYLQQFKDVDNNGTKDIAITKKRSDEKSGKEPTVFYLEQGWFVNSY